MADPTQAKALERIQKLMRLATQNPNEAEATAAAVQAVKLITEHKFTVGDGTPAPVQPGPPYSPWQPSAPAPPLWEYQYAANQRAQGDYDAMWRSKPYVEVTIVDDEPQPPKRKRWGIF